MYIKTQVFLILGVSKSGFAAADYILSKGAKCYIYEELRTPKILSAVNGLTERGAVFVNKERIDEAFADIDVVVISPGVPINHEIAVKAKNAGKRIIGELEFGFLCLMPTVVAVTGTNGKTTTVSLIDAVFKRAGEKSELVGNVGIPVSSRIGNIDHDTVCVAEVSSFQLESVSAFCPHVACILNIAPDHLERHYTMENYIFLKKRIFKNQKESEYTVLNFDDETVKSFASDTKGKVVWVSVKEKVDGAYASDGKIYFQDEYIMDADDVKLRGTHNLYDGLFAVACCKLCGIDSATIAKELSEFKGVKHRLELIAEKNGVKYIDDSKSTNTASAITAIDAFTSPTIMILGGSEKGEKYDALFARIKGGFIKQVILTGASRFNMLESAGRNGLTDITLTADFEHAVIIAAMFAEEGDSVVLSPACASFDAFSDYEERGDVFRKIVESMP